MSAYQRENSRGRHEIKEEEEEKRIAAADASAAAILLIYTEGRCAYSK